MQKFIVTGGLGFIGSNLIKILLDKNYYVINVDKVTYASNFYNIKNCIKKWSKSKKIECLISASMPNGNTTGVSAGRYLYQNISKK